MPEFCSPLVSSFLHLAQTLIVDGGRPGPAMRSRPRLMCRWSLCPLIPSLKCRDFCFVSGGPHGLHQRFFGRLLVVLNLDAPGVEMDLRGGHAVHGLERLLDLRHAGRAGQFTAAQLGFHRINLHVEQVISSLWLYGTSARRRVE